MSLNSSFSVVYWCFLPLSGCEEGLQSILFLSSWHHPAVLHRNLSSTPAVFSARPVWATGGRQRGLSFQRGQPRDGRLGTLLSRRHRGDQPVSGCRQSPVLPAGRGERSVGRNARPRGYRERAASPHVPNDGNNTSGTGNDGYASCLAKN